jgi:hypothetical protein
MNYWNEITDMLIGCHGVLLTAHSLFFKTSYIIYYYFLLFSKMEHTKKLVTKIHIDY